MKSAIILAGGRGVRIGGNKATIMLAGRPLITYILDSISDIVNETVVAISRSEKEDRYRSFLQPHIKIVQDIMNIQSPLVGILSAASSLKSTYTAVLSCDTPFVNRSIIEYLFKEADEADAAIPRWPDGRIEPLHAVYKTRICIEAAEKAIRAGGLSNWDMINRVGRVNFVSTEGLRVFDRELLTFFNINTLSDLRRAEEIITSRKLL